MNKMPNHEDLAFYAETMLKNAESDLETVEDESSMDDVMAARCEAVIANFFLKNFPLQQYEVRP